jgi:hypothetical protein
MFLMDHVLIFDFGLTHGETSGFHRTDKMDTAEQAQARCLAADFAWFCQANAKRGIAATPPGDATSPISR